MSRVLLAAVFAFSGCVTTGDGVSSVTPSYLIAFHVDDPERQAISGARVAFGDRVLPPTDAHGETRGTIVRGRYTVLIAAPGFVERMVDIDIIAPASYGLSLERIDHAAY